MRCQLVLLSILFGSAIAAPVCNRKSAGGIDHAASYPISAPYGYPTVAAVSAIVPVVPSGNQMSSAPIISASGIGGAVFSGALPAPSTPPQIALVGAKFSNVASNIPSPSTNPVSPATANPQAPPSSTPLSNTANSNTISGQGVTGISWDPYKSNTQTCKTGAEIAADIKQLASCGYANIRLYGVDCNSIDYALTAVAGTNTKLIIAIYTVDAVDSETASLVSQVNNRWNLVHYVSVFNEAVNDGRATVSQVQQAITYVKANVPSSVKVTTIDTFAAFIANPSLCNVGQDFIAANIQPYFGAIAASDAGNYVAQQRANVAFTCKASYVAVTESGWPAEGETIGAAVPSQANKITAVKSIIAALAGDVIVFEAFNDLWKAAGPNGVENSFGLYASSSP